MTVSNDAGECEAVVTYTTPVGTDNCASPITTLTAGLASGSTFPLGTTVVTYQVTDASGNTADCSFNVTVEDTEDPTVTCPGDVTEDFDASCEFPEITCPSDITVSNDAGVCGAIVTYTTPVGTDNCTGSVTTLTAGQASGTEFPVGVTTVTYQVEDA